jgi:hypothetical protein
MEINMEKVPSAVSIFDTKEEPQKEVLRIETSGEVFWLRDGEMKKVEMDSELAQAFAYCVVVMSGVSNEKLIEEIRKEIL